MPRRADPDPPLPPFTLLADATGAGLTRHQVRQRVRSGAWSAVARASYLSQGDHTYDGLDTYARARLEHFHRAIAAAIRNPGAVVTDASAAIVHGLPLLEVPRHVQLGVAPDRWTGTRSGIDFRMRSFDPADIDERRVPVATAWRAWIDITRFGSLAEALTCGDFAARNGLWPEASSSDIERFRGMWGYRKLHRARRLVDGVRESPLEPASFAYFADHRLPLPRMQVEIRSPAGGFIARVDYLWERARLVGEADGAMKYEQRDDLYAEKRREDAIRSQGYQVLRWGMADLRSRALAERIRKSLV